MDTPRAFCWRVSLLRLRNQTGSLFPLSLHGHSSRSVLADQTGSLFPLSLLGHSSRSLLAGVIATASQSDRQPFPNEIAWTLLAFFAGGCHCHGFATRQGAFSHRICMDTPRALCWRVSLPQLRNQTGSLLPLSLHGHSSRSSLAVSLPRPRNQTPDEFA